MRWAIVGSRDLTYSGADDVKKFVRDELNADDVVVSGFARGTDRIAEKMAEAMKMRVISFRPINVGGQQMQEWAIRRVLVDPYAPLLEQEQSTLLPIRYPGFAPAAFVRNGYIVEVAERCAVFWDGHSKGTKDTLRKAQSKFGVNGVELFRVERLGPDRKAVGA